MSTITNTLDALLTKYYHTNTPPHEKDACLNVFNRKCKANNINAVSYKTQFEERNINKRHTSSSTHTSRTSRQNNTKQERRYRTSTFYNDYYNEDSNWDNFKYEYRESHVNINSYDYQKNQDYVKYYGKFKQCIFEKGNGCIHINALYNHKGRWLVEDFVFYCGGDVTKTINELKHYQVFTFTSNGKRYAGRLNINRIWGYNKDKVEHAIY